MSSPKIVAFSVFDPVTGAAVTGYAGSLSFDSYKNEAGADLAQPAFVEIGGGGYYFTPTFASPSHGIFYVINTAGKNPSKLNGYLRPEDFNTDNVDVASSTLASAASLTTLAAAVAALQLDMTDVKDSELGTWKIWTSGPDANKLVMYRRDGVTVLKKFDLLDSSGVPTVTNPFSRNAE